MNELTLAMAALAALGILILLAARRRDAEIQTEGAAPAERRPPTQEAEPRRAEQMLERMAEGVLLLDPDMRPTFANRSARTLLGLQAQALPTRLSSQEIAKVARRAGEGSEGAESEIEVFFPRRLALRVQASRLDDAGSVMVVLLDVTEERKTQRIRREFVAHASHELKSPVASLQTLAEAVTQALPDDTETATRFAGRLVKESGRLAKLVDDLLDLSRLEDPTRIPDEPCDLAEVVQREIAHADAFAQRSELKFTADIEGSLVMRGDPQQLSLLVRNLLENAIQYTPAHGSVRVTARRNGAEVVLEVKDNGPGIPSEARSRIFERFYRLDKGRARDRGGTGLGLAIVKHVAEVHQGTIELDSELGEGSTFRVRLPAIDTAEEVARKESA